MSLFQKYGMAGIIDILSSYSALIALASVLTVLYHYIVPWIRDRDKLPLPPGPPTIPIIGNLHQMSLTYPWKQHTEWTKKYGPIFRLKAGKDTIIILGTMKAARDLLDKRSRIYSSRPRSVMAGECVSKGLRPVLMPYGDQWKDAMRVQGEVLNYKMSQSYREVQQLESLQMLRGILLTPENFGREIHRYSVSTLFALAYGQRMVCGDEEEIKAIDLIVERFSIFGRVGMWIVDIIPALNILPTFLAPWKRQAERCHEFESKMHMKHLNQARTRKCWNFVKQVSGLKSVQKMSEKALAYTVAILLEAGSETTTNALETFLLGATLHPRVISVAQAELDAVIGSAHLPTLEDLDSLPYIDAMVKETLRWRPVTPSAVPHLNTEEDEYMGYRIPQGSIVIANLWGIHLDPEIYPEPNEFRPERWLEMAAAGTTIEHGAFGFGRRICTGRHIAYNSLFLNIARLLWACDIGPKQDMHGRNIPVNQWGFSQGFISRPLPFECHISSRTAERRAVVENEWDETDKDLVAILDRRSVQ